MVFPIKDIRIYIHRKLEEYDYHKIKTQWSNELTSDGFFGKTKICKPSVKETRSLELII